MKMAFSSLLRLAASCSLVLLASACAITKPGRSTATTAAVPGKVDKTAKAAAVDVVDEHDDYAPVAASDPLERLNRGVFWVNDKTYAVLVRPVSKGYEIIFPKPVRRGITNAFENVKFPVRFVNCALQGKFKRAGQETGKFFVNTVAGVGGVLNVSDKIPALTNVPGEDTGQTFATWGIGGGPYLVLPFFGPCNVRDTVGMAGDYALNPVNWGLFWHGGHDWEHDWTMIPPSANTLRLLPDQLATYDSATKDSVDPYISVRSAYIQARADAVKK